MSDIKKHSLIKELDDLTEAILNLAQLIQTNSDRIDEITGIVEKLNNENETLRRVVSTLMEDNVNHAKFIRESQKRLASVDN